MSTNQTTESTANSDSPVYIKENCDVLLNVAQSVYTEEIDRFKNTEFKISIAIAFIGVFIGVFLTYIGVNTAPNTLPLSGDTIYRLIFRLAIFILMVLSLLYFIIGIRVGQFEQFELSNLVTKEYATLNESANVSLAAASTYLNAVDKNRDSIDKKLKNYNKGLSLLALAVMIFAIHIIIEEVIKYA